MSKNATNNADENKYQYNGKELVDDHSLHWYHYGARFYDPALGRWHSIDPADEQYSPYTYCANNPVNHIDTDGRIITYQISNMGISIFDDGVFIGSAIGIIDYATSITGNIVERDLIVMKNPTNWDVNGSVDGVEFEYLSQIIENDNMEHQYDNVGPYANFCIAFISDIFKANPYVGAGSAVYNLFGSLGDYHNNKKINASLGLAEIGYKNISIISTPRALGNLLMHNSKFDNKRGVISNTNLLPASISSALENMRTIKFNKEGATKDVLSLP